MRKRARTFFLSLVGLLLCLAHNFYYISYKRSDKATSNIFDYESVQALYLNLDKRTDRKEQIVEQLKLASFAAKRITALHIQPQQDAVECWGNAYCAAQIGCQLAHMRALSYVMSTASPYALVFEDDFKWISTTNPKYVTQALLATSIAYPDWDVIAISLNILAHSVPNPRVTVRTSLTKSSTVIKILEAQTSHAYLVKAQYIPEVYKAFKDCDIMSSPLIAIDECWKSLQKSGNWYGFSPQLGTQRESFSDIEQTKVKYDLRVRPKPQGPNGWMDVE